MFKEVIFSSHVEREGKKYRQIYPVRPGADSFQKCAEFNDLDPDMKAFISKIDPDPAFIYVVAVALGAGESWSSNVNGDWFSRDDLIKKHHTFVQNGKVFHLHDNTPNSKAYGSILYSRFNPRMDRVELIFSVSRADLPEIVQRIENGDSVDVSMGTKVDYDVCSICGKKSKRFSDYCSHLKYEMNRIYPDGRKAMALNPDPNFFDISIVDIGADRIAKVLAKVAADFSRSVPSAAFAERLASEKDSVMDKGQSVEANVVNSLPEKLKLYWDSLGSCLDGSAEDLDIRGNFGDISSLISSLTSNGVLLRPHEFISSVFDRMGMRDEADDIFSNRVSFSDDSEVSADPFSETSRGSLPIPIPNYYFISRKMSPGSIATRAKMVMVKSSSPYSIRPARTKLEKAASGLYKNYLKTASQAIISEVLSDLAPILPKLFITYVIAKAATDSIGGLGADFFNPSSADTVYLQSSDLLGVPVGEVLKELNVTPSEMKSSVKEELRHIEKLMRTDSDLSGGVPLLKMSSAHVAPLHVLASAVSYMKLSGIKTDAEALNRLSMASPVTCALATIFPRNGNITGVFSGV